MIPKKIAVFISGPIRYVDFVRQNLKIVLKDFDYEIFYHLWTEDLGDKKRKEVNKKISNLKNDSKTKVLIFQKPYTNDFFRRDFGSESHGTSSINASMGMFTSINLLCKILKNLPDIENYSHVLRIRTDSAFLDKSLFHRLDFSENSINIAENKILPSSWFSDILMFCTKENFLKIWEFKNKKELYDLYKKVGKIPEKLVSFRLKNLKSVRIKKNIIMHEDFHIVFYPPRKTDPSWMKEKINAGKIKDIFVNFIKHKDEEQGKKINEYLEKNRLNSSFIDYPILSEIYFAINKKAPGIKNFFRKPYHYLYQKILKKDPRIPYK
jgi:hypothetical protein